MTGECEARVPPTLPRKSWPIIIQTESTHMIHARAMELVAALRSGKYQQTTGRLKSNTGFCCLGVACDISKIGKWTSENEYSVVGFMRADGILPDPVKNYFGFDGNSGQVTNDVRKCLSDMNDNGATFTQIADFIEQNWESL
jgi:hypothetical protein